MKNLFYSSVRCLLKIAFKICFRLKVEGIDNIPKHGGVLIACNHASYLDPPIIACAMPMPIYFMARDTLFRNPIFSKLIAALNAIPVKRGKNDSAAMNRIIDVLTKGYPALVFPEGTRTKDGSLSEANPGFALLAIKAGVPVLPMYIKGSYDVLSRQHKRIHMSPVTVKVGPLIDSHMFSNEKLTVGRQSRRLSEVVMEQMALLAAS